VAALRDPHGRRFTYLRLSITDACNFRCGYCLPDGWRPTPGEAEPLRLDELRRVVEAFSDLGTVKVRVTGGEPTIRRDVREIVATVAAVPGIRTVALSTNGYDLARLARPLADAGLSAVNVSVDSLDEVRFERATGRPVLRKVLAGVEAALAAGLRVKLNAVLLRGVNEGDVGAFVDFVRDRPITARFIELMQTGHDDGYFARHHVGPAALEGELGRLGWTPLPRAEHAGPAVEWMHPDSVGRIGFITPYAKDFCATCNRLRVTSRGALRLCLFGETEDASLRPLLQEDADRGALAARIAELVLGKAPSHLLQLGKPKRTWNLATVGG
jgi:cyclic pyranopterin phosphate synthase